ncbi:hypothetical protein LSH36_655g01039 [Paralvinella palmiformis]|uniref:Uncharacterized protein n=1 Tax=Paralvinella palmiformis TaxID=53620 RepID=A0AAD9J486_9ANNE|nr:hypothetical protein LSH36_655g01039 [Paralvinella palmiformis]
MTESWSELVENDNGTGDVGILAPYSNLSSSYIGNRTSDDVVYDIQSDNVTSGQLAAALAYDGNATLAPDVLSNAAVSMSPESTTPPGHVATTVIQNGAKLAMITDMQLHFIVVGCLFMVVVILALINLYIHFRSGGRVLMGVKIVGTERVTRRGGYTVKMTAKPNLFI